MESGELCLTWTQGNESYLPVLRQDGIVHSRDLGAIDVDRESSLIEMQEINPLDSYRIPGFWRELRGDLSQYGYYAIHTVSGCDLAGPRLKRDGIIIGRVCNGDSESKFALLSGIGGTYLNGHIRVRGSDVRGDK